MRALINSYHNWQYCAMKRFIGLIWEQFYFEKKSPELTVLHFGEKKKKKSITINKLTVSMLCNFFVPQILDSNSTLFNQAVCIVSFIPSSKFF